MRKIIMTLVAVAAATAAVPAAAQQVDRREARQEHRIHQGVRQGALTPGEAARLQMRERRLHRTEARMRWRNGGTLSRHQRHRLNRMENRDSRAIHRLRHNGRHD